MDDAGARTSEVMDRGQFYQGYSERKRWTNAVSSASFDYFDRLWGAAGFGENVRILEIGFGPGAFMDWARERGHRVVGFDLLPEMVDAALARGHSAFLGPFDRRILDPDSIDVICGFDVVEHLSLVDLASLLTETQSVLSARGHYLLRFPNGQSPLFGAYQYGDITHKTVVSPATISQLAGSVGLRMSRKVTRLAHPRGLRNRAKRWLTGRLRDALELSIGYAYFGRRVDLEPNATVVLERAR